MLGGFRVREESLGDYEHQEFLDNLITQLMDEAGARYELRTHLSIDIDIDTGVAISLTLTSCFVQRSVPGSQWQAWSTSSLQIVYPGSTHCPNIRCEARYG
jgi:hypothetical protein